MSMQGSETYRLLESRSLSWGMEGEIKTPTSVYNKNQMSIAGCLVKYVQMYVFCNEYSRKTMEFTQPASLIMPYYSYKSWYAPNVRTCKPKIAAKAAVSQITSSDGGVTCSLVLLSETLAFSIGFWLSNFSIRKSASSSGNLEQIGILQVSCFCLCQDYVLDLRTASMFQISFVFQSFVCSKGFVLQKVSPVALPCVSITKLFLYAMSMLLIYAVHLSFFCFFFKIKLCLFFINAVLSCLIIKNLVLHDAYHVAYVHLAVSFIQRSL